MKQILFLFVLLCCYGCSESSSEINENSGQQMYNAIKGTYAGTVMVDNIPQKLRVTIDTALTVRYLPLRPILERIYTGVTLDEAEKTAGSVVFTAPIDQMVISQGNAYLTLEPTDLVFSVKVDGKVYSVAALMNGTLFANRAYDELSVDLNVSELYCDGKSYDMTKNGVNYYVDNAKKE